MDTVLHSHTGLLGFNDRDLISNIVYLLKQRKLAFRFSSNSRDLLKMNIHILKSLESGTNCSQLFCNLNPYWLNPKRIMSLDNINTLYL